MELRLRQENGQDLDRPARRLAKVGAAAGNGDLNKACLCWFPSDEWSRLG